MFSIRPEYLVFCAQNNEPVALPMFIDSGEAISIEEHVRVEVQ